MKIPVNPDRVQMRGIAQAPTRGHSVEAFGNYSGLDNFGKSLTGLGAAIGAAEEERNNARAIDAQNKLIAKKNEVDNYIRTNMQLDKSADASEYYFKEMDKARGEIFKNSGIKTASARRLFEMNADKLYNAGFDNIRNYQRGEDEKYKKVNLENSSNIAVNTFSKKRSLENYKAVVEGNVVKSADLFASKGEEGFTAIAREQNTIDTIRCLNVCIADNDWSTAREILREAEPFVNAGDLAAMTNKVQEYERANDSLIQTQNLLSENGWDLNKTLSEYDSMDMKNDYSYNRNSLVMQSEVDWDNLKPEAQYGGAKVFEYAQSLGVPIVQISSGNRTPERNASANGSKTSWHLGQNGVDIVLLDEKGNTLSEDDPKVKQVLQQAKTMGWEEVGYHDYGSGFHVHLGGYKGNGNSKPMSAVDKEQGRQKIISLWSQKNRIDNITSANLSNIALNEFYELGKTGALDEVSAKKVVDRLVAQSGYHGNDRVTLERELLTLAGQTTALPNESNMDAYNALYDKHKNGNLQAEDVSKAVENRQLSKSHANQFFKYISDETSEQRKITDNNVDGIWEKELDALYPYAAQKGTKENLKAVIRQELYGKNISGDYEARLKLARDMMKTEKGNAGAIINMHKTSREMGEKAVALFGREGEKTWNLILAGQMAEYPLRRDADNREATQVANYIADLMIASKTQGNPYYGDPSYEGAWKTMLEDEIPITIDKYNLYQQREYDAWRRGD